jgi:hypothetical protein
VKSFPSGRPQGNGNRAADGGRPLRGDLAALAGGEEGGHTGVGPVLIGTGKHLFEAGNGQVALQLLESRAHGNGVAALRYGRPVMAP